MEVIITPLKGASPYIVPLRMPPVFGSQVIGGYSQATIVQGRVPSAIASQLLYGDAVIYGRRGPCWRGVVESSERDGTMHCVGPQQVLGWTPCARAGGTGATIADHLTVTAFISTGTIPTWLMPNVASSWAYWGTNPTILNTAITPPSDTVVSYLAACMKYDTWQYGWYFELIGGVDRCVPHYGPAPTTPDYIVTLSAEDAKQFSGDSLAQLANTIPVTWSGGVTTTTDTNLAHYLVGIGRNKLLSISSTNTASAADASLIAAAKFAEMGNGTKAGRISFGGAGESRIQRASGLVAYPPSIRPGALATVNGLRGGSQTLRITAVECHGDSSGTLELGIDAGRLDAMLARIGG